VFEYLNSVKLLYVRLHADGLPHLHASRRHGQVETVTYRHASLSESQHRSVGWLAVALGSGDVMVAPVPHPAAVLGKQPQQQQRQQQRADSPGDQQQHSILAVRLPAAVALASARVGGSLAATLEWLPRPPHDLLLVGHWDGTTALWRLAPSAAAQPGRCRTWSNVGFLSPRAARCHRMQIAAAVMLQTCAPATQKLGDQTH
jgi:hypothetical protein